MTLISRKLSASRRTDGKQPLNGPARESGKIAGGRSNINKDELRWKIAPVLFDYGIRVLLQEKDPSAPVASTLDTADQILSLINAERCVWEHEEVWYPCLYYTSCGKFYREEYAEDKPYCPFCGKRIEVKDE
jgi:DNA-directed RNA polymerase subunit RPC12/RpoP